MSAFNVRKAFVLDGCSLSGYLDRADEEGLRRRDGGKSLLLTHRQSIVRTKQRCVTRKLLTNSWVTPEVDSSTYSVHVIAL